MNKMLHIVFSEADIQTLQKAMELDASLHGEVWQIKDEFAVGPMAAVYETEGYQQRRNWWKELLQYSPYEEQINIVNDKLTVYNIKKKIEKENEDVWIWIGYNVHDVCGYYWLVNQLKDYEGKVFVLHLNNLPFINEKGHIFYPNNLFEIQPKEFLKAKKLARPVTPGEFEMDSDEWKKLCAENAIVRTLDGGKKIISQEESFYDNALLNVINTEPQKLTKALHSFYTKTKLQTGDVFLVWRIRKLLEQNKIIVQGDWNKGWKDISIAVLNYQQTSLYAGDK